MLGSLAFVVSGSVIVVVGVYLWARPEQYYRYLHRASLLADLNMRPPRWAVKVGAVLSVIIGLALAARGAMQLVV